MAERGHVAFHVATEQCECGDQSLTEVYANWLAGEGADLLALSLSHVSDIMTKISDEGALKLPDLEHGPPIATMAPRPRLDRREQLRSARSMVHMRVRATRPSDQTSLYAQSSRARTPLLKTRPQLRGAGAWPSSRLFRSWRRPRGLGRCRHPPRENGEQSGVRMRKRPLP